MKTKYLALAFIAVITLSGCQTIAEPKKEISGIELRQAIQEIVPKCTFEQIEIPNGKMMFAKQGPDKVDQILSRNELWPFSGINGSDPMDGWIGFEFTTNPEVDSLWACNSNGRAAKAIKTYSDIYGEESKCIGTHWPDNPEVLGDLASCIRDLKENVPLGYWIVVRESKEPEAMKADLVRIAEESLTNSYAQDRRPILLGKGLAVTLDGPFERLPLERVRHIDWVWAKIKNTTKLEPMGKFAPGYPKSYDFKGDDINGTILPAASSRYGLLDACFKDFALKLWGEGGLCKKLADEMVGK